MSFLAAACAPEIESLNTSFEHPHTGSEIFEDETNPSIQFVPISPGRSQLARYLATSAGEEPVLEVVPSGQKMFISGTRLRVRSSPEVSDHNILGVLSRNDQVLVVNSEAVNGFVEIEILQSRSLVTESEKYFTHGGYLQAEKSQVSTSPYFMVQNLATEILRVYKKECDSGCGHRLVLETDMVAGEKTRDRRTMTNVGYYHITQWYKFYQDQAGRYPSWYHPSLPMPPKAGSGFRKWMKKKYLPKNYPYRRGIRGAFGWYTAHVGPHANAQWTHGTVGWGSEKDRFIKMTRGFWANVFADPRSHGCSRTDNESIAYIRQLLDRGAPILKVYALEAYADFARTEYSKTQEQWSYILTRQGARKDGEKAHREAVVAGETPQSDWLEEGAYSIDAYPNAEAFRSGSGGASSGKNGNVYGLNILDLQGRFLIDEGRFVNYAHPQSLPRGGYRDQLLPPFVRADSAVESVLPKKTQRHLAKELKKKSNKKNSQRRERRHRRSRRS